MYISPDGQKYEKSYCNRVAVWEMTAHMTSSGLLRKDLKENRRGRIVSIRRSALMLERYQLFGGLKKAKEPEEEKEEKKEEPKLDPTIKYMVPGQNAERRERPRRRQ